MGYKVLRTFVGDDCRVYLPGSLFPADDREVPARIVKGLGSDGLIDVPKAAQTETSKPAETEKKAAPKKRGK